MGTSSVCRSDFLKMLIPSSFSFLFHVATWVSVILTDPVFYFLSSPYHSVYFPMSCTPLSVSEVVWPILLRHAWIPREWICLGWIQKPACHDRSQHWGVLPAMDSLLMLSWKTFLLSVFPKIYIHMHSPLVAADMPCLPAFAV